MNQHSFAPVLLVAAALLASTSVARAAEPAPTRGGSTAVPKVLRPLKCAALVPSELIAKHFAGMSMTEEAFMPGAVTCDLTGPKAFAILNVVCVAFDDARFRQSSLEQARASTDGKDLAGVGRAAYRGGPGHTGAVQFWDDDTNCLASLNVTSGDPTPAAIDLVRSINPTTVGP
ncbi:MAG: hypothetical protein Q8P18_07570 [Pseudomonadota bacterium]|nr:hypothetical protein [Pseudomonadota bacterium]